MIETGDIQVIIEDGTNANLCQQIAYIKAGKTEIEDAVQEGIGDFNTNATEKTNTFNSNASAKTLAFNQNADAKTAVYDNNASEKLSAYNENATNKLAAYNANDTAKTGAYNLNATNKTTAFNNNASEKTSTFNDNAIAKTSGFNSNATSKTNDFNSNASNKTDAFNDNYTAKKALIDAEVQTAKDWATKTDGTVDGVDYSAKYYAQSILPIKDDITAVAGIATDVSDVADIKDEVTTVANDKANIDAVAEDITNVNTVAGDHANIQTVVNNMMAINNAPTYANNSKIWAEGLDGEVTPLGGTHSAKGWAEIAEEAASGVQNPANRDLSNLTNTGQMIIDSQNGTISNCILEIPQDIKLTLENNVLTLKSGSVITAPDGSQYQTTTDGTKAGAVSAGLDTVLICVQIGTNVMRFRSLANSVSGAGATTASGFAYDTTTNKIGFYSSSGVLESDDNSMPICIVSTGSDGKIASIDQVFNGAGFIGHHAFVLPNVKGLFANGINNGNLQSSQYNSSALQIIELSTGQKNVEAFSNTILATRYHIGEVDTVEDLPNVTSYYYTAYVKSENVVYYKNKENAWTNQIGHYINLIEYTYDGTTVTDFTIQQPVRLATTEMLDTLQDQVDTNTTAISGKQDTLVSGTNIKTINSTSVLGSGNFTLADQSLSNLTTDGKNIGKWSTNVTNCITEIPQDIKLELNNGTLTLKAGSKVYVPNGAGVFDVVTVSSDAVFTQASAAGKNFLFYTRQNAVTRHPSVASGTSIPSGFTGIFYNTSSNQIYYCSNGTGTESSDDSFPIAIVTIADNQTANISSIDQVFNGFGYIGSTIFALPNVKGLIPNGRNADGSLKNVEFTTNNVVSYTLPGSYSFTDCPIILNGTNINFFTNYSYNENDNIVNPSGYCLIGTATTSESKVTSLTPKTAFHAVDYNDFADLKDEVATKQADVTTLTGYDSTQTQTLKNINGVLTWVTD